MQSLIDLFPYFIRFFLFRYNFEGFYPSKGGPNPYEVLKFESISTNVKLLKIIRS